MRHFQFRAVFLERLPDACQVAMSENSPDTSDKTLLKTVAFYVLVGDEMDDSLSHCESYGVQVKLLFV
jgi:hypothetical protein